MGSGKARYYLLLWKTASQHTAKITSKGKWYWKQTCPNIVSKKLYYTQVCDDSTYIYVKVKFIFSGKFLWHCIWLKSHFPLREGIKQVDDRVYRRLKFISRFFQSVFLKIAFYYWQVFWRFFIDFGWECCLIFWWKIKTAQERIKTWLSGCIVKF